MHSVQRAWPVRVERRKRCVGVFRRLARRRNPARDPFCLQALSLRYTPKYAVVRRQRVVADAAGSPLSSLFGRYDHPAEHVATYKGRRLLAARPPPRRSQRAELPHWAPALRPYAEPHIGQRMSNGRTACRLIHSAESVGSRFVSLRQSHRAKYSLPACERAKIPNKHGPSPTKLCTAAARRKPKIYSLRPLFSEPLDFADLGHVFS